MDGARFDAVIRTLARAAGAGSSRRSALRTLAAVASAAVLGKAAVPRPVTATGCAGFGCPCSGDDNCLAGLVCCGNACETSGYCGLTCTGTGDACPAACSFGEACADCCGGFCTSSGACTTIYYAYEGGACSLADPTACAPGLTCCPTAGGDASDGVCQDNC
jgi:hypothetical protein